MSVLDWFRPKPKTSLEVMKQGLTPFELSLFRGKCPDCGGHEFYDGPSGGLCQNIKCAGCAAEFNVAVAPGLFIAERIGV